MESSRRTFSGILGETPEGIRYEIKKNSGRTPGRTIIGTSLETSGGIPEVFSEIASEGNFEGISEVTISQ